MAYSVLLKNLTFGGILFLGGKDVIGSGGKIIQDIIKECNEVKIDIEQDGRVFIMHSETCWINKAIQIIQDLTKEAKVGDIYEAKVVKIMKFGAFVELWPGYEGLVHISQLARERVAKVEDVVREGDEIVVKVMGFDEKGKVLLSRKEVLSPAPEQKEAEQTAPAEENE